MCIYSYKSIFVVISLVMGEVLFWLERKTFYIQYTYVLFVYVIYRHFELVWCDSFHTVKNQSGSFMHTEKSFQNHIKSNWNQIVFTIFRLKWNRTVVRLFPNQSENDKYNLISVSFLISENMRNELIGMKNQFSNF